MLKPAGIWISKSPKLDKARIRNRLAMTIVAVVDCKANCRFCPDQAATMPNSPNALSIRATIPPVNSRRRNRLTSTIG